VSLFLLGYSNGTGAAGTYYELPGSGTTPYGNYGLLHNPLGSYLYQIRSA
jgi:hypothetical protein